MKAQRVGRRKFLGMAGSAAVMSAVPRTSSRSTAPRNPPPKIKFGVIGINHSHINSQVEAVQRGGGELVVVLREGAGPRRGVREAVSAGAGSRAARRRSSRTATIQLVLSSAIPDERAPLGIRVMQHGKDYMADKPGITTLEQLAEVRRVQAETRRIYSIMYSERLENRATVKAGELVKAGAIGRVVQTIGLGPHRMNPKTRPAWFFERPRFGGILCDIGSHQADQFLYFTGSTRADVVAAQVGNVHHPQYPDVRGFRRRDAARRRRHRLHPRRLVHARRPGDLGRRAADHSRHRRLHRDPQEHRHRRPARREPPVPGRSERDALHRLPRRAAAVRRAARLGRRSTAPRRRCRRRTASWRPSWC